MLNKGPSPQHALAHSFATFSLPCTTWEAACGHSFGGSKCEFGCHNASVVLAGAQCRTGAKLARGDRDRTGLSFGMD